MNALNKVKPQLVAHWRLIWRQWSFQLGLIGTVLTSVLLASPDLAIQVWAMMPEDLKATLPARFTPFIGVGVFALGLVAKFIKQAKLEAAQNAAQLAALGRRKDD